MTQATSSSPRWFFDNALTIGRTPLVRLGRITDGAPAILLAKIEGRNPAYSVKDRIGAAMVWDAENRGVLTAGKELIEPTSGNTGIALAFVAAARGYPADADDARDDERRAPQAARRLRRQAGAHRWRARHERRGGEGGSDRRVGARAFRSACSSSRTRRTPPFTRRRPAPRSGTRPAATIDIFVSGVGTGGTITGVSRYIKQTRGKPIISVAVEPDASPVLTQTRAGAPLQPGPHKIQGIGAGFVPDILDLSLVDAIEQVSNDESIAYARRLAREEGILAGISCGAAVAAAVRIARRRENEGKTIVTVLPDSGERYLSSPLFEGVFDAQGLSV